MSDREKQNAYNRAYYQRNKEAIKAKQNEKKRAAGYRDTYYLKYKFGLTLEEYDAMRKAQDYRCAGCGRHETEFNKSLCVDHDHSCCEGERSCGQCIRGLLCMICNTTEGQLTAEQLAGLLAYKVSKEASVQHIEKEVI